MHSELINKVLEGFNINLKTDVQIVKKHPFYQIYLFMQGKCKLDPKEKINLWTKILDPHNIGE